MKNKEPDYDESVGTMGPATCPIDLKSDEIGLRDQSSPTRDGSNPKEDAMMKMIADRVKTKFDECGGMPCNDDTKSRAFLT